LNFRGLACYSAESVRESEIARRRPDSNRDWPGKCSGEGIFRIKIGSAFLCYFLLQRQKKVETSLDRQKKGKQQSAKKQKHIG